MAYDPQCLWFVKHGRNECAPGLYMSSLGPHRATSLAELHSLSLRGPTRPPQKPSDVHALSAANTPCNPHAHPRFANVPRGARVGVRSETYSIRETRIEARARNRSLPQRPLSKRDQKHEHARQHKSRMPLEPDDRHDHPVGSKRRWRSRARRPATLRTHLDSIRTEDVPTPRTVPRDMLVRLHEEEPSQSAQHRPPTDRRNSNDHHPQNATRLPPCRDICPAIAA